MEDNKRQVKGIWCPIEIWEAKDLSWEEKVVLLEVDSFTRNDKDCYISDEYIANLIGKSSRVASRYMSDLIAKGYIIRTRFDGRMRFVKSAISYGNCEAGTQEMAKQVRQNWRSRGDKNGVLLNNITNTKDNNMSFELPYQSAEFIKTWELLKCQPKWKNKSVDALRMSVAKLARWSEVEAIEMMEESIANGWQGLFAPKKGSIANNRKQETFAEAGRRVMEALKNGN